MTRAIRSTAVLAALLASSVAFAQTQEVQATVTDEVSISLKNLLGDTGASTLTTSMGTLTVGGTNETTFFIHVESTSGFTINARADVAKMTEWDTTTSAYTSTTLATALQLTVGTGTAADLATTDKATPFYTGAAPTSGEDLSSKLKQPVIFGDADLSGTNYYKMVITYTALPVSA